MTAGVLFTIVAAVGFATFVGHGAAESDPVTVVLPAGTGDVIVNGFLSAIFGFLFGGGTVLLLAAARGSSSRISRLIMMLSVGCGFAVSTVIYLFMSGTIVITEAA